MIYQMIEQINVTPFSHRGDFFSKELDEKIDNLSADIDRMKGLKSQVKAMRKALRQDVFACRVVEGIQQRLRDIDGMPTDILAMQLKALLQKKSLESAVKASYRNRTQELRNNLEKLKEKIRKSASKRLKYSEQIDIEIQNNEDVLKLQGFIDECSRLAKHTFFTQQEAESVDKIQGYFKQILAG